MTPRKDIIDAAKSAASAQNYHLAMEIIARHFTELAPCPVCIERFPNIRVSWEGKSLVVCGPCNKKVFVPRWDATGILTRAVD